VLITATVKLAAGADGRALTESVRQGTVIVGIILCGSPAAATELRVGDHILSVNGRLPHEPGVLPALQYPRRAGDTFLMQVRRGEDTLSFTVTSIRRPKEAGGSG
jgi:S1-C subfamily serine protease